MRYRKRSTKCKSKTFQGNDDQLKLSDFADHSGHVNRLKKTITNGNLSNYAKSSSSSEGYELSWFDKGLDEFSVDENLPHKFTEIYPRPNKHIQRINTAQSSGGVTYPIDIWFLIARYVMPENVQAFAGICRSTNAVVHTASFWCSLYFRFCSNEDISLPEELRSTQLERIHGVRSVVIRSLFLVYPPFIERFPNNQDPHIIVGRRCIALSHRKTKSDWKYSFKFINGATPQSNMREFVLDRYDDAFYNPDEGCSVLVVACKSFHHVQLPLDLVVTRFNMSISSEMCYHKLTLGFNTKMSHARTKECFNEVTVVIDPVVGVNIYDWWHPRYQKL